MVCTFAYGALADSELYEAHCLSPFAGFPVPRIPSQDCMVLPATPWTECGADKGGGVGGEHPADATAGGGGVGGAPQPPPPLLPTPKRALFASPAGPSALPSNRRARVLDQAIEAGADPDHTVSPLLARLEEAAGVAVVPQPCNVMTSTAAAAADEVPSAVQPLRQELSPPQSGRLTRGTSGARTRRTQRRRRQSGGVSGAAGATPTQLEEGGHGAMEGVQSGCAQQVVATVVVGAARVTRAAAAAAAAAMAQQPAPETDPVTSVASPKVAETAVASAAAENGVVTGGGALSERASLQPPPPPAAQRNARGPGDTRRRVRPCASDTTQDAAACSSDGDTEADAQRAGVEAGAGGGGDGVAARVLSPQERMEVDPVTGEQRIYVPPGGPPPTAGSPATSEYDGGQLLQQQPPATKQVGKPSSRFLPTELTWLSSRCWHPWRSLACKT
jgi:hypothetical protein